MKLIILDRINTEQDIDDIYYEKTIQGFAQAKIDINNILALDLEEYIPRDIRRMSLERTGSLDYVIDKLKYKLHTLLTYIEKINIKDNILEVHSKFITYGLSAITNIYCGYKLMNPMNIENYEIQDTLDKYRRDTYKIYR